MKKHLIAAAVAAAVAVPAMAQNVTLSGRASMEVGQWQAKGATAGSASDFKNRTRVADTASRITFAANEDLGGGLSAGVYCETGINIDNASNTGQAATNNPNTSEWCSREGHARLGNSTAEIRLGRQNVWWTQGALNNVGSAMLGSDTLTNLLNAGYAGGMVYGVRLENMIKVVANKDFGAFAGSDLYFGVMGPSGGNPTVGAQAGESAGAGVTPKGKYHGFKLNYGQDALVGMVDGQFSNTGGATPIDRSAYKVGLGYRYAGASSPSIITIQYWDRESTAAGAKTEDKGYGLVLQYAMADGLTLHGQWGRNNDAKLAGQTVSNSGALGYTLGLTKAMSKRTHLYASYHNITNESAGAVGMGGGNYQSGSPAAGADTRAWGLGMIHNF